ncbi:MAG TPA: tetratricopeptide repeat protein [Opitutaceae bacterium]
MAAAVQGPFARNDALTARVLAPVVLVAAVLAAYASSLHGAFVFDDPTSIAGNATIRHLTHLRAILATPHATVSAEGRPVLNLSLALNYAVGGTSVEGYHWFNLAIHAAASLALFGVLRRIFALVPNLERWADELGWAVALVWAVHPLQTESVTYVIQRAESLMGLFYLLTLYAFLRGWNRVAVIACFLGMATKEDMVSAPLAVLLCDGLLIAGSFRQALRARRSLYAGMFCSWALLAYLIAGTGGNRGGSIGFGMGLDALSYWYTQFPAITRYLSLSIWPHPLVFEYGSLSIPSFWLVWRPAAIVAALAALTGVGLVRRSPAGWAGFCFFAILAPTSLVPGTTQMIVEHRMYLPLAALLAVVAGFAARRWPRATIATLVVAAVPCLALTRARNRDYRTAVNLWDVTVQQRPQNVLARIMLANALHGEHRDAEALTQFKQAVGLRPRFPLGQEAFGEFLLAQGRAAEAAEHFRAAMAAKPDYADAHVNFGVALGRLGDVATAVAQERRAVALAPAYETGHYELARLLARDGRTAEAAAEYRRCLELDPDDAAARSGLSGLKRPPDRSDPGGPRR